MIVRDMVEMIIIKNYMASLGKEKNKFLVSFKNVVNYGNVVTCNEPSQWEARNTQKNIFKHDENFEFSFLPQLIASEM